MGATRDSRRGRAVPGWLAAFIAGVFLLNPMGCPGVGAQDGPRTPAERRLATVETWFYYLSVDLEGDDLRQIIASDYDMVVIDPVVTEVNNEDYDIAGVVQALHDSGKLVIAYMDIGQAEDYRTYWLPGWRIGDPPWIVGADPDGWSGNYPVAFWWDEWQTIWFDPGHGLLPLIMEAGFDGIYMDWVEAYADENVAALAEQEGVDPVQEMIGWVEAISSFTKAEREDFIVIAQNAAELVEYEGYLDLIDGIAQEAVWFDGAADGARPEGDCPLPRTEAEIDTEGYRQSLTGPCRRLLDSDPYSQLHTSSEEYLAYLELANDQGEIILTVDYALEPAHVAWIVETSRGLGFKPFVGARALDRYIPPYAP